MMRPKFRISMRSIGLWSCFIVLMGLSGFRWDVGVDFMNYYVQFGDDLMNEMLLERIEIGNHAVKYLLQLNCSWGIFSIRSTGSDNTAP